MAARSIKDAIASGGLKTFIDRRLIEALGHPVREHVLAVLNERPASASEIGREINVDVADFYHHVEVLEDRGFLERVASKRRRGAMEHFYRAKEAVLFDDNAWRKIPPTVRSDLMTSNLQLIWNDTVGALRNRIFATGVETHVSRIPGVFDRRGWKECMALIEQTLRKLMEIQERSAERIAATGEKGTPATVVLMGFESPAAPTGHSGPG